MEALSDIEMLQEMDKSSLLAIHLSVDPPTMGPAEMMDDLEKGPGGENYYEDGQKAEGFKTLFDVNLALAEAEAKITRRQESIARTFYNDLFLMLANAPSEMTATEVIERQGEKLLMLGPVLERQQNDFHDPLIDRVFAICNRAGMIPPAPEEIIDMEMKVQYISILAIAQLRQRLSAIRETAQFVATLSQFKPEAKDKFNQDKAIDHVAEVTGVPPEIINSNEDVAGIRQQRVADMAKQKQMDMMTQGADAAKILSEIDLTGAGGEVAV